MRPKFEFNYLGEVKMSCYGYDLVITNKDVLINTLRGEVVFMDAKCQKSMDPPPFIDVSTDERFYIIDGIFNTYVFDSWWNTFSVYKGRIEDEKGVGLTTEYPIWGNQTVHIRSGKSNYSLQFPFFAHDVFKSKWDEYKSIRREQIKLMINSSK